MNFVEQIYKKVCKFFQLRHFVYRIDIYNGTEESNSIYDNQVMEYEFINQGTTACIINDGLYLYPEYMDIEPSRIRMVVNSNERDDTVYQYRFEPPEFIAVRAVFIDPAPAPGFPNQIIVGALAPAKDFLAIGGDEAVVFNKLIVKSKVIAVARK